MTRATRSDAQIDFWGGVYCANPGIAARGITFGEFIERPDYYLHGVRAFYTLSSKEQAVLRQALRLSVRVVANGRVVEKLRHHRHPRGAHRDFQGPLREG